MSSNKNARLILESIYGKGSMFKKAECEKQIEKQKLKIKGYKSLKTKSKQMTYHHLKHRSEGGQTDVENGAILSTLEHEYVHSLPREQEEIINNMIREYKSKAILNFGILIPEDNDIQLENVDSKEIDDEIDTIEIPVYDMTDKDKEYYNRAKEKEELQKCIKDYYSYKDREEK